MVLVFLFVQNQILMGCLVVSFSVDVDLSYFKLLHLGHDRTRIELLDLGKSLMELGRFVQR